MGFHTTAKVITFVFLCLLSHITKAIESDSHHPKLLVFDTRTDVGVACARAMIDLINNNNAMRKKTILGLVAGSIPVPAYDAFREIVKNENIDLSNVITFNVDEYLGLVGRHPQSNQYFMFSHLFYGLLYSKQNPLGFRLENLHFLNGKAKTEQDLSVPELIGLRKQFPKRKRGTYLTTEQEIWVIEQRAKVYDAQIAKWGPIQLQILGLGTSGQIAFIEPDDSLQGGSGVVKLSENTRKEKALFFGEDATTVPEYAVSMGIGTLLRADEIYLLVTGTNRAKIFSKFFNANKANTMPATALKVHDNLVILADKEASSLVEAKAWHHTNDP